MDDDCISQTSTEDQEAMEVEHPSEEEEDDDSAEEVRVEALSRFKEIILKLICQFENNFEKDSEIYLKAINAFVKTAEILSYGNDSSIQKALFTFGKEAVQAVKKGRRKNAGKIPVQSTVKSRRRIQHRGAGPSIKGRPTISQTLRLQLDVMEDDEIVSHKIPKIPARNKKKSQHPHSLAAAVAANRAAEKKH